MHHLQKGIFNCEDKIFVIEYKQGASDRFYVSLKSYAYKSKIRIDYI